MTTPSIFPLWPDGCPHNDAPDASMQAGRPAMHHCPAPFRRNGDKPRAAILICPGGGYAGRARHEGEPLAMLFAQHGIDAFVVDYRVSPNRHPAAYDDVCRAIRLIRSQAASRNIDPHRIGLMGFSAGGHLAATVALQPHLHHDEHDDLAGSISARPDRVVLGYPVISALANSHQGSFNNLLGEDYRQSAAGLALRRQLSNELHVTAAAPPAFVFHTAADQAVPCQNSLRLALAYADAGVRCELHQFENGPHGVGMAVTDPKLRPWTQLLITWLADWVMSLN